MEGTGGGVILGDGHQQLGRCSDLPDDRWIGRVSSSSSSSGFDGTFVDERHVMAESEIDFVSRELSNLPLPLLHDATTTVPVDNVDVLPGNIAAPFPNVGSHVVGDDLAGPRARGIEMARLSYASGNSSGDPLAQNNASVLCNVVAPVTPCIVAPTSATTCCNDAQATLPCRSVSLLAPQLEACAANTAISRNCQLAAIDVEDLAMYFDSSSADSSSKPASTSSRAIHARKSKQGLRTLDCRDRFDARPCDQQAYGLPPRISLGPGDPRGLELEVPQFSSDLAADGPRIYDCANLPAEHRETTSGPQSCDHLQFGNNLMGSIGDPRRGVCDSDFDASRASSRDLEPFRGGPAHESMGQKVGLGQSYDFVGPRNDWWYCNDCPELFNLCSEERWLQCPASDRCPLYDPTYNAQGVFVLPPCMYENLYSSRDGNDNYYDCTENEQLLENYL